MNCIVIDDDLISRLLIEKYIEKTDFLNLLKSYSSAVEALKSISKFQNIDIIFLDIEMPEMTGIEFLSTFKKLPQIIIISAREVYAIEAIEFSVTDYLLKPISFSRFFKAVTKAKNISNNNNNVDYEDGIFFKIVNGSYTKIIFKDILWVEALENYMLVKTITNEYTIHISMKQLEEQLPHKFLIRIHRAFIVNISKIESFDKSNVVIKVGSVKSSIPIGRLFRDNLINRLNIIN